MTFDELIKTQDKCSPGDWSSLSSAYRFWIKIARAAWEAGYAQCQEDSDPDSPQNNPDDDWWKQP